MFLESRRRWNCGNRRVIEWTLEGERTLKFFKSVAIDGDLARKSVRTHDSACKSGLF